MSGKISWLMPEQMGPASDLYQNFAESLDKEQAENEAEQIRFNLMNGAIPPTPFQLQQALMQTAAQQKRPPPPRYDPPIPEEMKKEKLSVLMQVKGIEEMSPIALIRAENPASVESIDFLKYKVYRSRNHAPWITSPLSQGMQGLHEEIIDFHNWIRSTPEEYTMRHDVVLRVEEAIKQEFPGAQVEVFGSFQTGLYLPTSDIDMVVLGEKIDQRYGNPQNSPHYRLQDRLLKQGIAERYNIKVIDSAAVPIIKMRDMITDIKVDISFNMKTGVTAIGLVKGYIRQFPALRYLVLVLKQFLLQRDMNEVWTGGISSYGLILMVVSFLQQQGADDTADEVNLGVLLIKFLRFYGMEFEYSKCCIRVKNGGQFIKKEEMAAQMKEAPSGPKYVPNFLSIEDPLTPSNDVGRASHGAENVKDAFLFAYRLLDRGVSPQALHYPHDCNQSILGRIILITDEVYAYRNWVMRHWKHQVPRLQPPPPPPAPEPVQPVVVVKQVPAKPHQGSQGGTDPSDDSADEASQKTGGYGPLTVAVSNNNRQVIRTKNSEPKIPANGDSRHVVNSHNSINVPGQMPLYEPPMHNAYNNAPYHHNAPENTMLQDYSSEDAGSETDEDDDDDVRSRDNGDIDADDDSNNEYDRGYNDYPESNSRKKGGRKSDSLMPSRESRKYNDNDNGRRVRTNSINVNPMDAITSNPGPSNSRPNRSSQSDNSTHERSDDHSSMPNASKSPNANPSPSKRINFKSRLISNALQPLGVKNTPGERNRKSEQGPKGDTARNNQSNSESQGYNTGHSRTGSGVSSGGRWEHNRKNGRKNDNNSYRHDRNYDDRLIHMPPYGNMVSSGMHHRNDRGFNNRGSARGPARGGAAMDDPYSYRTGSNQMDHPQDHRPRGDRDRYGGGGRSGGGLASDSTRTRKPGNGRRDGERDLYQPRKSNDNYSNDRHREQERFDQGSYNDRDGRRSMDQGNRRPY
ncbi:Oidioi.mRNA.OKI2018_I69.chr1.g3543.t2.cds [Oikopleura dioica]|uniref:Oidioi.mRNA.OKI2018_I69.chr1.g3543.t2.cds n=1 Tax=Oikopleura dioica TaxID=34765 RepID=A0ABN7SZY7_OIKDI|nr:Oidioi.mRNA.OKI2018_I69.chr1.g3543.t2.cds [Oikopleura dioica]